MLREIFIQLIKEYSTDEKLQDKLWNEIETSYSTSNRHYHTLHHLESLLKYLEEIKSQIKSWKAVLFALFYHDIVYNPLKSDNEEKSAEAAVKSLVQINAHTFIIDSCSNIILATKKHLLNDDSDVNFFTDADLSILGSNWDDYLIYSKQIRKEYSIYPDLIYNPGRKKVLQHFLEMERIYKTEFFFNKFEAQAKENLKRELGQLYYHSSCLWLFLLTQV